MRFLKQSGEVKGKKKTLKSPKDGIEEISEKMDNQKIFMEH